MKNRVIFAIYASAIVAGTLASFLVEELFRFKRK